MNRKGLKGTIVH